jgi:Putative metallopeptidase
MVVAGAHFRKTEMIIKKTILIWILASMLGAVCSTAAKAAQDKTRQIRIQYVSPVNSEHQPIYERLKQARALERLQDLLSPIRLPQPLLLKVSGCEGDSNAWYEEGVVTVCYEFLHDILKSAPEQTLPSGVTQEDAILGPFLDVFLHEVGHAVFDLQKVPVLGREEDAADMFSAYIMLQLGKDYSHRLILGSAYQYKADVENPQVSLEIKKFSDEHGVPAQRFYNVLCVAYGADPKMFADVVEKGYLPESRTEQCDAEYEQTAFAFKTLIGPHIDKALAKKVLKTWMRDVEARPRYRPSR